MSLNLGFVQRMKILRHGYDRIYFTGYAARNWGHRVCAASTEVEQLILDFLESEAKVSASSQTMMVAGRYSGHS
jgi:hypothetical protein